MLHLVYQKRLKVSRAGYVTYSMYVVGISDASGASSRLKRREHKSLVGIQLCVWLGLPSVLGICGHCLHMLVPGPKNKYKMQYTI